MENKSNVLTLTIVKKSGQSTPTEGKEIVFKDGARFLFAGYISRVDPTETGEGALFTYQVEATDYTYILNNKYAQKSYENQTLHYIVTDLLATYVHAGYGLTSTNVLTVAINTIGFNHISLRKCFEKLSNVTGYIWWIDYQKDSHFVEKTTDVAPESITDSSENFSEIAIALDTSQVRNSVTVRGGREEINNNFEQIILAMGKRGSLSCARSPKPWCPLNWTPVRGMLRKPTAWTRLTKKARITSCSITRRSTFASPLLIRCQERPIKSAPRIAMKCRHYPVSDSQVFSP